MNIRADASFKAGDWARLEALLVPKLTAGIEAGTKIVFDESQQRVPVDTGELKASGKTEVEWKGSAVTGYVAYSAGHAAFVEYGIRQRGAAGEWAGPFSYSEGTGFAGFGYIRGSLDPTRPAVLAAVRDGLAA